MGVISTGAIFKTLTFDGKSSAEFNVYITGEGVFNAPERAVEMISIPGRNGAFALDYGRFENIEVTYNCGIAGDNDADFASAISDFRNWLCSRNGYVRLSDDYNTGEYRMAVYKSGLEVTAENLKAGEFPVVFECKPQRFLTSGETAVAVISGDDITNPTLFNARPLLEITGYGKLNIANATITINNTPIGEIVIANNQSESYPTTAAFTVPTQYANANDPIVVQGATTEYAWIFSGVSTIYDATATITGDGTSSVDYSSSVAYIEITINPVTFNYGTPGTKSISATVSIDTSPYGTLNGSISFTLSYDGNDTFTLSTSETLPSHTTSGIKTGTLGTVKLNSSQLSLGTPLYVDLDIGEAYKIENGVSVSVNNAVTIPAELPTLAPGTNTITYDNTITQLDIVPRWWRI